MSLPWKYIKLSALMSSVKSDLNLYDDAGMIDEDRVIKVIAECNEKLGQRIYKSRECKLTIVNGYADIPDDLYKIENIFATEVVNITKTNPNFGASQVEFTPTKPKDTSKIVTYGKMACTDSNGNCYWIEDKKPVNKDTQISYERIIPLNLTNTLYNRCTEYSPCTINTNRDYKVDVEEGKFKFSFDSGEVYLCYLGNLIDEDGEIEIPFHPMLNSYYEYAVKEKILEDIYINSESDVIQKLQYISQKKKDAYGIAWNFANTKEVNEWNKIQKKLQREYYNKWYKMYN